MAIFTSRTARASLIGAALIAFAPAANAATVVFTPGGGNLGANESDYANFDTTFGTPSNVTGTSGGYSTGVFASSVGGIAAQPAFGDQGDAFYAVLGGGTTTFTFDRAAAVFGFDLGSADSYNSVTLHFASGGSQTFTGSQLNVPFDPNGNQDIMQTNGRVTFSSFGDRITGATFASDSNSLEFDNLGVGGVPEPSVWALFILGFGTIGGTLRGRTRKVKAARAALI